MACICFQAEAQAQSERLLMDLLRQEPRRAEQLLATVLDAAERRPAWYLIDTVAGAEGLLRLPSWPRRWLEVAKEQGGPGWFVVLTGSEIVERRLRGRPWYLPDGGPYGVSLEPLIINLRLWVRPLSSGAHPELAPLAVWAMRHYPEQQLVPVLTRALALSRYLPPAEAERQIAEILRLVPDDINSLREFCEEFSRRGA